MSRDVRAQYPQADPPDPVTCGVYLAVAMLLVVVIGWVLLKGAGVV